MSTLAFTFRPARAADMLEVFAVEDDAGDLFGDAGIVIDLSVDHPLTLAERARWTACAEEGRLVLAVDASGAAIGFAALGYADGLPYLDEICVRRAAMRRGVGRALVRHVIAACGGGVGHLWLTTYSHVPWNRPFYESEGFRVVSEAECGPDIRHHLEEQRRWLPHPEERVAMRRPLRSGAV